MTRQATGKIFCAAVPKIGILIVCLLDNTEQIQTRLFKGAPDNIYVPFLLVSEVMGQSLNIPRPCLGLIFT